MKPRSLGVRLALSFALLAMLVIGGVGTSLYHELERQLVMRDDMALIGRVDQLRTLLADVDTLALVRARPQLFENMLGNREALLVLRFAGEAPLVEVNPAHRAIPDPAPVAPGAALSADAVQRSTGADGVPFISMAAAVRTAAPQRELHIIAGRTMGERSAILNAYRQRVLLVSAAAALLVALLAALLVRHALRPLRVLSAQTAAITMARLDARLDAGAAPRELAGLVDAFNAMLERLATGFRQLSQVSADMAHDLRTPIGNLLGQTEVALGQPRSADYYETILASNLEELQRLSTMTDNMLFLARSEQPGSAIERQRLDAGVELQRIAAYFEGLAEERGLRVRVEVEDDAIVWADALQTRRALANLMSNAVRYADADTEIVLSARVAADGAAALAVENSGPTIPPAQLERLFERFYRADAARRGSADASGLGLSIVRSIMALHQGAASAASSDGRTRFTLTFPPPK